MNKILIIGNGFDRKIGLKTDYNSFLDWMNENEFGVGVNYLNISNKMLLGVRANGTFDTDYPRKYEKNIDHFAQLINYRKYTETFINNNIEPLFNKNVEFNKINITRTDKLIYFLLPDIINQSRSTTPKLNFWYCFLQVLRHKDSIPEYFKELKLFANTYKEYINPDGNWIDIEGIIKKTISKISTIDKIDFHQFNFFQFQFLILYPEISTMDNEFDLKNTTISNIIRSNTNQLKKHLIKDFLDFKQILSNYIELESKKNRTKWPNFFKILNSKTASKLNNENYNNIINFNYTHYLDTNLKFKNKEYNVHGNTEDGEKIVFGLDPFEKDETPELKIFLNETEKQILNDSNLSKFTKISQLLTLQKNKHENYIENKVSEMVIIGHSLGIQDYSYFFSIFDNNIDHIRIECLWYKWDNGKSNNEISTEASLFEMLLQYERTSKRKILHRMIFEGRIKFTEIEIPNLTELK